MEVIYFDTYQKREISDVKTLVGWRKMHSNTQNGLYTGKIHDPANQHNLKIYILTGHFSSPRQKLAFEISHSIIIKSSFRCWPSRICYVAYKIQTQPQCIKNKQRYLVSHLYFLSLSPKISFTDKDMMKKHIPHSKLAFDLFNEGKT